MKHKLNWIELRMIHEKNGHIAFFQWKKIIYRILYLIPALFFLFLSPISPYGYVQMFCEKKNSFSCIQNWTGRLLFCPRQKKSFRIRKNNEIPEWIDGYFGKNKTKKNNWNNDNNQVIKRRDAVCLFGKNGLTDWVGG